MLLDDTCNKSVGYEAGQTVILNQKYESVTYRITLKLGLKSRVFFVIRNSKKFGVMMGFAKGGPRNPNGPRNFAQLFTPLMTERKTKVILLILQGNAFMYMGFYFPITLFK